MLKLHPPSVNFSPRKLCVGGIYSVAHRFTQTLAAAEVARFDINSNYSYQILESRPLYNQSYVHLVRPFYFIRFFFFLYSQAIQWLCTSNAKLHPSALPYIILLLNNYTIRSNYLLQL